MATTTLIPGATYTTVTNSINGFIYPSSADATGGTDSATAVQNAVNACSSAGGGCVWLGSGTYKIGTTINLASGVSIVGQGVAATSINNQCSGDLFKLDSIRGCTIAGMTIDSTSVRSAGYAIRVSGGDTSVQLGSFKISRSFHAIDVDMNNQFDGILIEDKSATNGNWSTTVGSANRVALWRNFAVNRTAYDCNTPHGATQLVQNIFVYGNATPANGPCAFRVRGSGDTTIKGCSTWGVTNGLLMDPDGIGAESVMVLKTKECFFDFGSVDCFRFFPGAAVTCPIVVTCTDSWFASSLTAAGAHGSNTNAKSIQVTFNGCQFMNNATYGIVGDNGCDATTFKSNNGDFGPPLSNITGTTHYV